MFPCSGLIMSVAPVLLVVRLVCPRSPSRVIQFLVAGYRSSGSATPTHIESCGSNISLSLNRKATLPSNIPTLRLTLCKFLQPSFGGPLAARSHLFRLWLVWLIRARTGRRPEGFLPLWGFPFSEGGRRGAERRALFVPQGHT